MKIIKKIFKFIGFFLLIAIVLGGGAAYYILLYPNTNFKGRAYELYIPTGSDYEVISERLYPVLSNSDTFFWLAKGLQYTEHVRPGRYVIRKGMNNLEMVRMLRNLSQPIKLSFNNQDRLPNLAQRISQEIEADSTSLMNAFLNSDFLYSLNVIGIFIPNTYEFYWNTSAVTFVEKMEK